MQAAQVGHVVQQDHRANELAGVIAQRRRGELDGTLLPRGLADEHRTAAQRMWIGAVGGHRFADRIGEQLAVVLVEQPDHVRERLACHLVLVDGEQLLGGRIQVHQAAIGVRGDDGLGQRLHGEHLQRRRRGRWLGQRRRNERGALRRLLLVDPAGGERAQLPRGDDLDAGDQQRRRTLEIDDRGS